MEQNFKSFGFIDRSRGYKCYTHRIIDVSRIVAIEKGDWDNEHQDWQANLVIDTGQKFETNSWYSSWENISPKDLKTMYNRQLMN